MRKKRELDRRLRASTVSVRDRQRANHFAEGWRAYRKQSVRKPEWHVWPWVIGVSVLPRRRFGWSHGYSAWTWPASLPDTAVKKVLETVTRPPAKSGALELPYHGASGGYFDGQRTTLVGCKRHQPPHLTRTFKLSSKCSFRKNSGMSSAYLNPPEKALVLCCDEKSQCQSLERTQPGLPLGIGHIKTTTHDYIRHGTLTLFAALNYLTWVTTISNNTGIRNGWIPQENRTETPKIWISIWLPTITQPTNIPR